MYFKRTVILKNAHTKQIVLCTLEQSNNNCKVIIKNCDLSYKNAFIVASVCDEIFYSALTPSTNNTLCCEFSSFCDCSQNISVALGCYEDNNYTIIASESAPNANNLLNILQTNKSEVISKLQNIFANNKVTSLDESEEQNEFYQEQEQIEEVVQDSKAASITFYDKIEPSIMHLLQSNPPDQILQDNIPHSRFAKIEQADDTYYHSVGVIYDADNTNAQYICFALPCAPNSPPPQSMEKFAQLLIVNDNLAYYLMYQNATTGENVIINN